MVTQVLDANSLRAQDKGVVAEGAPIDWVQRGRRSSLEMLQKQLYSQQSLHRIVDGGTEEQIQLVRAGLSVFFALRILQRQSRTKHLLFSNRPEEHPFIIDSRLSIARSFFGEEIHNALWGVLVGPISSSSLHFAR